MCTATSSFRSEPRNRLVGFYLNHSLQATRFLWRGRRVSDEVARGIMLRTDLKKLVCIMKIKVYLCRCNCMRPAFQGVEQDREPAVYVFAEVRRGVD